MRPIEGARRLQPPGDACLRAALAARPLEEDKGFSPCPRCQQRIGKGPEPSRFRARPMLHKRLQ